MASEVPLSGRCARAQRPVCPGPPERIVQRCRVGYARMRCGEREMAGRSWRGCQVHQSSWSDLRHSADLVYRPFHDWQSVPRRIHQSGWVTVQQPGHADRQRLTGGWRVKAFCSG
jgi:hypothetical protein